MQSRLLPAELRAQLPALFTLDPQDPMICVKFFLPGTSWTWFIAEGSPENNDFILFGYVIGLVEEWSFISLNELESICMNCALVEREVCFEPGPFSKVLALHNAERGNP